MLPLKLPMSSPKPKLLVIFPDEYLAYSPSVINLRDVLSEDFDVSVLAFAPQHVTRQRLERPGITYLSIPRAMETTCAWLSGWVARLGRPFNCLKALRALWLLRAARRFRPDQVVGVDFLGLWVAQKAFGSGHLLSLEIRLEDYFYRRANRAAIRSVLTQDEERYRHQFPDGGVQPPHFVVPNSPVFRPLPDDVRRGRDPSRLVFFGSALAEFGIFQCLDFLVAHPRFTLTVRGAMSETIRAEIAARYGELLADERLIVDRQYVENDQVAAYLSQFRIGLCCYDLSQFGANAFNYATGSAGKLFNYYAAGVPVVGSDLPGMRSVREFDAGVLIPAFTPENLLAAVERIEADYDRLAENALRAAAHFSFDRAVRPFRDFLLTGR